MYQHISRMLLHKYERLGYPVGYQQELRFHIQYKLLDKNANVTPEVVLVIMRVNKKFAQLTDLP